VLSAEWLTYGVDNNGALREASWSRSDGNNTCPNGFRVPTVAELSKELTDNKITNMNTAFASFLKLGASAYRRNTDNAWIGAGSNAYIWTSTAVPDVLADNANYLFIESNRALAGETSKGNGMVIRCIKD